MPSFGEILRRCRKEGVGLRQPSDPHAPVADWTQEALAKAIGLSSPDMIRRWERNDARPSKPNFVNLRNAFSTDHTTAEHAALVDSLTQTYNASPGHTEDDAGVDSDPAGTDATCEENTGSATEAETGSGNAGADREHAPRRTESSDAERRRALPWVAIGAFAAVVAAVFAVIQFFSPADPTDGITQGGSGVTVRTNDNSPVNIGGGTQIINGQGSGD